MEFRYNGQVLGGTAGLPVFPQGMTIYAEEETVVGTCLGKPLYRKVIQTKSPATPKSTTAICSYPEGSDQNTIVSLSGFLYQTSDYVQPINIYAVDNYIFTVPFPSGICMNVTSPFVNKDVRLILEYTKTTDASGSMEVLPANYVQDYDTEDGWHVRKYSDGYVEMSIRTTVVAPAWTTYTDASSSVKYTTNPTIPAQALPVPLVERYTELVNCGIDRGGSLGGSNGTIMCQAEPSATPLTTISTVYPTCLGDVNANWTLVTSLRVTGRWK